MTFFPASGIFRIHYEKVEKVNRNDSDVTKKWCNYFKALNLDVEAFAVDADLTSVFLNSLGIKVGDPFVISLMQSKRKVVAKKGSNILSKIVRTYSTVSGEA